MMKVFSILTRSSMLHVPDPIFNASQFQTAFYVAGGGFQNWTALMRQMVKEIHGNTTNVATYIGPGNSHCGVLDPHGLANWFWVVSVRSCGMSLLFLHLQSVRCQSVGACVFRFQNKISCI
jgi:hypothetical protein